MPYNDPDPKDPTMLVGVEIPAEQDADLEMAYAFAEEFAAMGFSEKRLLSLFHQPFYSAAYRACKNLGEEKIKSVIREALHVWGGSRFVIQEKRDSLDTSRDSHGAAETGPRIGRNEAGYE